MSFTDKTLTCKECGQQFLFTIGEQEFHQSRGFENEPGRCPDCRAARKARMGTGNGMSSGRSDRTMYPVTCSRCGKEAVVPFQPRGDRPVYCSECYSLQSGGAGQQRRSGGMGGGRRW